MKFFLPGPRGVQIGIPNIDQLSYRKSGTSASRRVYGANKAIALAVFAKPNGNYSGTIGNGVTVTVYNAGSGRAALQFFFEGSQITPNVVSGIATLPAALASKASLAPHFYIRLGDLTDQAWDAGAGEGNGSRMRGGS